MALVARSSTEKLLPVGYAEPFFHAASGIRTQGEKSHCSSLSPRSLFVLHVRDRNTHSPGQGRREARKNSKRIQPLTGHLRLLERRAFLSRITRPTGPASNWLEDENYAAANVESNCELHPGCGSVCAGFWRKPSTPRKYKLYRRAGLHRRAAPR